MGLRLKQLRPSGVQPAAGLSRLELGMMSPQNLDCETQNVYFPQLPWCLNYGEEILHWQLSCGTLRTQPYCPLNSLRVPRTLGQGRERESWGDRACSSFVVGTLRLEKGMERVGGSWVKGSCKQHRPLGWPSTPTPPTYPPRSWTCPERLVFKVWFSLEKNQANYATLRCNHLIASPMPSPGHGILRHPCLAQGILARWWHSGREWGANKVGQRGDTEALRGHFLFLWSGAPLRGSARGNSEGQGRSSAVVMDGGAPGLRKC